MDACVLNRIAQLLSGDGAVEIDYKGARLAGVEEALALATEATGEVKWREGCAS